MYAIIRAGGRQEKVEPGEQITIDRRKEEVGHEVTFAPLMVSKDDGTVVSDKHELEGANASVVATIVQHVKADKVDIFQYRNKTGYRRHVGHRQPITLIEIKEIRIGGEVATKPEPAEAPAPEAKAEKAAPKKKAAAKPKAAAKKTAAKKTATKKAAPKDETE